MRIKNSLAISLALLLSPAAALAGELVVLDDRFDDNAGGWWLGDDGNDAASIQAGRMRLTRRVSGGWATWRGARVHQEESYRIETTVTITEDQDNYGCGLWFGSRDGNNGFVFEVGDEGQYRFFHYDNGTWVDETSWQSSSAVRKGIGSPNTLSVVKQGAQWALYINGQYVNQVPARPFYGQNVGFRIEARMTCEVDRLLVLEEEGPRAPGAIAVGAYPGPGERLVLDEPFDTNALGWALAADESGSLGMQMGKLMVRHLTTGGYVQTIAPVLDMFGDYRIEMSLRVLEDQDNYGCGLFFGASDVNNGYSFEVSDDGFYRQIRFEAGVYKDETSWQKHPAVRTGLGSQNHLSLVKSLERWFLYVNGTLVDRVPARPLFGARIGLRLEGRMACEVDHLRVVALGPRLQPEAPVANVFGPAGLVAPPPREEPAPERPAPIEPAAPAPRVVAVFEVLDSSNRLSKQERSDLTEYLMARLTAQGGYAVVPTDTLKQSLTDTKKESYKDCYDTSCQIALGKAVAAELVLTTKLLRVAGECAITATLFDVKKEATIKAATLDTACEMKGLLNALKELVKQL
ncbi:MAG TPA: hypothetical protein PK668_02010 [Myxococcota bacterium]|nr:hypothetical protein [Myxococcota bacterium]HRY94657.1 hypothetical protein [Myxococcota bacterium]HSA20603.1 hypothetical protein [Myxococcota bacterium]